MRTHAFTALMLVSFLGPPGAFAEDDQAPPPPPVAGGIVAAPAPAPPAPSLPAAAEQAPPAPQVALAQATPQQVTLRVLADTAPQVALAQATPQQVTLRVLADTAPPAPPPQIVTLSIPAAAPAAPSVVAGEVRHPGKLRRAVGNFGAQLEPLRHPWVLIPAQTVAVQPSAAVVQPVTLAPAVQAAQAYTLPVTATPQGAGAPWGLFRLHR
jgi:hypothetical protein